MPVFIGAFGLTLGFLSGDGTVSNCIVTGNSAHYNDGGSRGGTLYNSIIISNTAGHWGGGSYHGTLNNCTLSGNSANHGGGCYESTLSNCIVYNNTAVNSGDNWLGGGANISYSCTDPWPGGTGNITNNPLFVDSGDFHLQPASPCIDAGHNSYVTTSEDLDGNPRIVGGVVDMGAYENQAAGTDVDGDVMTDLWEMTHLVGRHFANTNNIGSNNVNTALEAYIAGLDPNDANSFFQITNAWQDVSGFVIEWEPSVSGRWYSVNWTNELTGSFITLTNNIDFPQNSYTDSTHNAEDKGFYQIDVQLTKRLIIVATRPQVGRPFLADQVRQECLTYSLACCDYYETISK